MDLRDAPPRHGDDTLRAVLDAVPDAVVGVGADGTIELVNRQAEQLFGWTAPELIGRKVEVLVPGPVRHRHVAHRTEYSAEPVTRPMGMGVELSALRKDGSSFPAEISLSSVDHGTSSALTLAAVRDITERVVEAQRAQQRRAESQRMESLGQLAGGIAHDFNNLLGVILNYASVASRHVDDPAVTADLAEIQAAAELGASLTRQLLTFARREPVMSELIDVSDAVKDTAWLLNRTLGEDIDLELDLTDDGATAFFGRGQLEQILLNLALNSRAAMPNGGVFTVQVSASAPSHSPRTVTISVTDTGVGMTAEIAQRAFEPFFSTKALGQGTGLGLASVYGIVQQNDGRVDIRSGSGEGTTITVVLPYASPAGDTEPRILGRPTGHGERILVVEDEDALRTETARLLMNSGYIVLEAADGRQALDLLHEEATVDLIVTDVAMPQMRGDQLAAEVGSRWPGIPLIYVTGIDSGVRALGRPTVLKPVDEAALLTAVRTALDD